MSKTNLAAATFVTAFLIWAVSFFMHVRSKAEASSCIGYLYKLRGSKEQWSIEFKKAPTDIPTWDDLFRYLRQVPQCPSGGTYTLGRLDANPTCSKHGWTELPTTIDR
jgi:hypothetical protein